MITDDALRAAAKEASLALAEALTQGSKQQPSLRPKQVLYMQNEPSVPP